MRNNGTLFYARSRDTILCEIKGHCFMRNKGTLFYDLCEIKGHFFMRDNGTLFYAR